MTRSRKRNRQSEQVEKKAGTPEQVIRQRLYELSNREDIRSFFFRLAAMLLMLWLLFGVLFGMMPMRNDDMKPCISAGDLLLYYRMEQNFHVQDVIVFEKDDARYVGRIVAQEGDAVEVTEQAQLMINGSVVLENDIYFSTPQYDSEVAYPVELEKDQYFVLCDYREGARDSRYFGAVDRKEIRGTVITVIRRSGL